MDDPTITELFDRYMKLREAEVGTKISSGQYVVYRNSIRPFVAWYGDRPVKKIDGGVWEAWYAHVLTTPQPNGDPYSSESKKKFLAYPKHFLRWLVDKEVVKPFTTLADKRFGVSSDRAELETLSTEVVSAILASVTDRHLKCMLMVMLNTGMSQVDISQLTPKEYRDGRIVHGRSKTSKRNTRSVSWILWQATIDLIEECKCRGELLFRTSEGEPWRITEWKNGKHSLVDRAGKEFGKLKTGCTLKQFRALGGSKIRRQFGKHVADHFLGHGQNQVEAAYFAREQAELDEAVLWLGKELKVV